MLLIPILLRIVTSRKQIQMMWENISEKKTINRIEHSQTAVIYTKFYIRTRSAKSILCAK